MSGIDPAVVIAGTAVIGSLITMDSWRRNRHLVAQDHKMDEIHVLVNSRLTEALDRIDTLEEALHLATGIPKDLIVPPGKDTAP